MSHVPRAGSWRWAWRGRWLQGWLPARMEGQEAQHKGLSPQLLSFSEKTAQHPDITAVGKPCPGAGVMGMCLGSVLFDLHCGHLCGLSV